MNHRLAALALGAAALAACGTDGSHSEPPAVPATPGAAEPPPAPEPHADPPPAPPKPAAPPEKPERATIELGPWQGELLPLLEQHAERAKGEGLVPFVYFYADWCPPCKALKRYWGESRMAVAFKGTYIVVLNVDDWQDKLKGTGFVPKTIPVFYAVDAKGKPTGRKITGDDWGKNKDTPDRMAPALEAFFAAK
jgi:thiol-disulfide isomerase/thioredoxin